MNVTRPGRRRSSAAAICAIAAVGIAGCGGSSKPTASTPTTAPAGGGAGTASTTLTTAWPTDITSLDPANLSTGQDHDLSRNIYQTLALPKFTKQQDGTLKFDGAHVQPYVAKSWTLGKSSITFHLRKGVKFYGTNDVMTASDVKFSLGRVFETPGGGDLQSNGFQGAKDIHVIDPQTVRIDFKSADGKPTPPTPTLEVIFSAHFTGIVDE